MKDLKGEQINKAHLKLGRNTFLQVFLIVNRLFI